MKRRSLPRGWNSSEQRAARAEAKRKGEVVLLPYGVRGCNSPEQKAARYEAARNGELIPHGYRGWNSLEQREMRAENKVSREPVAVKPSDNQGVWFGRFDKSPSLLTPVADVSKEDIEVAALDNQSGKNDILSTSTSLNIEANTTFSGMNSSEFSKRDAIQQRLEELTIRERQDRPSLAEIFKQRDDELNELASKMLKLGKKLRERGLDI